MTRVRLDFRSSGRAASETSWPWMGPGECVENLPRRIEAVAGRSCAVLIEGELGTGKELVARAIHAQSARRTAPFIAVDCARYSETLFESQLFGHEKGVFAGAEHASLGFFRAADRGILFLNEIGELTPSTQARLLHSIKQREVVPVGCTEPIAVDVRIIAATHRNLADLVRRGRFRKDLSCRIDEARLFAPPLRERRGDIPRLARQTLRELARLHDVPDKSLSDEAAVILQSYPWPGNDRELRNILEVVIACCEEPVINVSALPREVRAVVSKRPARGETTISR